MFTETGCYGFSATKLRTCGIPPSVSLQDSSHSLACGNCIPRILPVTQTILTPDYGSRETENGTDSEPIRATVSCFLPTPSAQLRETAALLIASVRRNNLQPS